jgi:hypothetical protein
MKSSSQEGYGQKFCGPKTSKRSPNSTIGHRVVQYAIKRRVNYTKKALLVLRAVANLFPLLLLLVTISPSTFIS